MPVIQGTATLTAGATNENVLAGSQYEFMPYNAALEFGFTMDGDVVLDVYSGSDVLAESMSPVIQATQMPIYPDDFTLTDVAAAGERIKVRARNTDAANPQVIRFSVRITPLM